MIKNIQDIMRTEYQYFETDETLQSLQLHLVAPHKLIKTWQYGKEKHECWVIADDPKSKEHIVYCETGFGPDFSWGRQRKQDHDMGRDDVWFAYLYEAFISSTLWKGQTPEGGCDP